MHRLRALLVWLLKQFILEIVYIISIFHLYCAGNFCFVHALLVRLSAIWTTLIYSSKWLHIQLKLVNYSVNIYANSSRSVLCWIRDELYTSNAIAPTPHNSPWEWNLCKAITNHNFLSIHRFFFLEFNWHKYNSTIRTEGLLKSITIAMENHLMKTHHR